MNQQQLIEQIAKVFKPCGACGMEKHCTSQKKCALLVKEELSRTNSAAGASWMRGEGERLREELDTELRGATNDIDLIRVRLASGSSKDYLDIKLYELTMRLFKCLDKLSKPQTEHE